MQFLNNKLEIKFYNGKNIIYGGHNIFTSLDDIQADGKTLIEHCTDTRLPLYSNIKCFVIDIDIENVICVFDLDKVFEYYYVNYNDNRLLEQAVYGCLEQNKVIGILYKKAKAKSKIKSRLYKNNNKY